MAKWYKRLRDGPIGEKLNIVFVSSDRNVESFNKYLRQMPWLALPYSERDRKVSAHAYYLWLVTDLAKEILTSLCSLPCIFNGVSHGAMFSISLFRFCCTVLQ